MKDETRFLIRVIATPVQEVSQEWSFCSPLLAGLLDIAGQPICGALEPGAARALTSLGVRLPVLTSPEDTSSKSIDVLLTNSEMKIPSEWVHLLAPGALIVSRGSTKPIYKTNGTIDHSFELEAGLALTQLPGGKSDSLRDLLLAFKNSREMTLRLERICEAIQMRNAHVLLADGCSVSQSNFVKGQKEQIEQLKDELSRCARKLDILEAGSRSAKDTLSTLRRSGTWSKVLSKFSSVRKRVDAAGIALETSLSDASKIDLSITGVTDKNV